MIEFLVKVATVLNSNKVNYLIVGGCARMVYFQNYDTKDLDILIEASCNNLRIFEEFIFKNFKTKIDGSIFKQSQILRFNARPYNIDFLSILDGVDMSEVFGKSNTIQLGRQKINFISRHHLIANLNTTKNIVYGLPG